MADRKAYVIEGRASRSSGRWTEQCCECGYGARRRAYSNLQVYRERNPRHVFRVVIYRPTESKSR